MKSFVSTPCILARPPPPPFLPALIPPFVFILSRPHLGVFCGGGDQPTTVALSVQGVGCHHVQQQPADPEGVSQHLCSPLSYPLSIMFVFPLFAFFCPHPPTPLLKLFSPMRMLVSLRLEFPLCKHTSSVLPRNHTGSGGGLAKNHDAFFFTLRKERSRTERRSRLQHGRQGTAMMGRWWCGGQP
jgi:hypothetical protein